ncbi:MGMT family protein [Corynebacterium sp.]|uniref:MGMT family protein n=1 Tax=Corynebacterium sp. TaxID=1720 RepID=UPI0034C60430
MLIDDLTDAILSCCDRIPPGMVAAYGDIAAQVGCNPRHVGRIMRTHGHLTCWWRVVRADGTSAVADRAQPLWEAEGIISTAGRVDMASCRFDFDDRGGDFPLFHPKSP